MPETIARRNPARTAGALFAGFAVIVLFSIATDAILHSTHIFAPEGQPMAAGLWLFATLYRCVYAVLGCNIAARLAPDRPMGHALVLGAIGVVLSTLGTVATWDKGPEFGPKWYPISLIVTSLPCAWLGAKLHRGNAGANG
jgi:hypothetical protein